MFHIGVATKHPPLPDPGQLSPEGINFIKRCLTIDPMSRPTAVELLDHEWMQEFAEAIDEFEESEANAMSYEGEENGEEKVYDVASVARQAAAIQQQEIQDIKAESPPLSDIPTPDESANPASL